MSTTTDPLAHQRQVAVITIVHGRHRHLRRQLESIDLLSALTPIHHVVVAMGDDEVQQLLRGRPTVVAELAVQDDGQLPLGAARNLGAEIALDLGADLLVFLDVDCLPDVRLVEDYLTACATTPPGEPAGPLLWCGEVAYLPPLPPGLLDYPLDRLEAWADPHPARPRPAAGATEISAEVRLFWSLNFAVSATDWGRIGAFHPGYRGYGGEDTDFAVSAAALGGGLGWIGGARAYHQYHPTNSPPWQHLSAIVRNATLFHSRWGWFPMEGWLEAFAAQGAVRFEPAAGVLQLLADPITSDTPKNQRA